MNRSCETRLYIIACAIKCGKVRMWQVYHQRSVASVKKSLTKNCLYHLSINTPMYVSTNEIPDSTRHEETQTLGRVEYVLLQVG